MGNVFLSRVLNLDLGLRVKLYGKILGDQHLQMRETYYLINFIHMKSIKNNKWKIKNSESITRQYYVINIINNKISI